MYHKILAADLTIERAELSAIFQKFSIDSKDFITYIHQWAAKAHPRTLVLDLRDSDLLLPLAVGISNLARIKKELEAEGQGLVLILREGSRLYNNVTLINKVTPFFDTIIVD